MRTTTVVLVMVAGLQFASVSSAAEYGFSFGPYMKGADITRKLWIDINQDFGVDPFIIYTRPENLDIELFSSRMGQRSAATSFSFFRGDRILHPRLELQNIAVIAFGAEKSAKPHTLMYSADLNYFIPFEPYMFLFRVYPFIGAGVGYAYNFGTNYGKYVQNDLVIVPDYLDFPGILGDHGTVALNFGGGVRVNMYRDFWIRFAVRDHVFPGVRVLDYTRGTWSRSTATTHNIMIRLSLAYEL